MRHKNKIRYHRYGKHKNTVKIINRINYDIDEIDRDCKKMTMDDFNVLDSE